MITLSLSSQVRVSGSGSNTAPYNSWATAATNLQTGIDYAAANAITEVWVEEGTYTNGSSFVLKNGVTVYGGFDLADVVLADRDYSVNITILSGANVRRVINHNNDGTDATAVLDGVTIQQGALNGAGAGIYLNTVSPTFLNCIIQGNSANGGQDGGGVYITGNSTSVFTDCTFSANTAGDDGGGVFTNSGGSNPVFTGCTFSGNISTDVGGAVSVNSGNPVFHRCFFSGNQSGNDGGAIYNNGNPQVYTCLFTGNTAVDRGGAICSNVTNGTFLNNTISGNTAANGGAFSTMGSDDPQFYNCIFWGNTGTTAGNEVFISDTGSDPWFRYCCIEGGTAAFGGSAYPAAQFINSITTDPQFINAGGGDFNLTLVTSPAIGVGDPTTTGFNFPTNEDMNIQKRVRGTVDMGAYETNNPPTIVTAASVDNPGPDAVTMDEDGTPTAWAYTVYVIDPDNDDVTWTISTAATNGVATPNTGTSSGTSPGPAGEIINYVPTADYNGTDMFVIEVSDGMYTDQIQVDVTINPISDPPTFTSTAVTTSKSGLLYTYNIVVDDPDVPAEVLTITCPTQPGWLITFTDNGNRTGVLTATPGDLDVGIHNVVLEVSDGVNPAVQQIFDITVDDRAIYVPSDYPTIQQGIDAAVAGDKVVVAAGIYIEDIVVDNRNIEIQGDPASPSSVTIQGTGSGPVVTFVNGGSSTIDGFTITNGIGNAGIPAVFTLHAPSAGYYGGGVYIYQANATLDNLILTGNNLPVSGNYGGSGAAIYIGNVSNVTIGGTKTVISGNNSDTYRGGGICIDDSNVTISGGALAGEEVLIDSNSAGNYGGGIAVYNSTLDLTEVIISNNSVTGSNGRGGGIYEHNSTVNIISGVSVSGNSASTAGNDTYSAP